MSSFIISTNLIEKKQKESLFYQLDNTKLEIEDHFNHVENTLSNLELYLLEDKYSDQDLLQYMISIANNNQVYYSIYFGKTDNTMINSSGFVPDDSFDLRTRPWYTLATSNDGFVYTPGYLNASQDKIIINIAKAVYLNNSLIGVLSTDIDISSITSLINNTKIGQEGFAFLIDGDDHLIAYHGLDNTNLSLSQLDIDNFNTNLFNQRGFTESVEIKDTNGVIAYDLIANQQYVLGVFLPKNEYSSPLHMMRLIFIVSFIVFFISSIVIFTIYYKHIDEPFRNMISAILKIDVNKDSTYRIDLVNKRDFKPIVHAINQALDSTESHIKNKHITQNQLSIENQRVKLLMESTSDIIFEIDSEKRFVSVFGKGIQKINLNSQDFIGRTIKDIFGKDGTERDEHYTLALQGKHTVYDWQYQSNTKMIYFESSISPIHNEKNEIIGAVGISRDITESMERQEEIKYISHHDFLTSLYNRRYFVKTFTNLIESDLRPIGLMMMDLNGLKLFNDAYGHDIGDLALQKASQTIKELSPQTSTLARVGGDEFAMILPKADKDKLESIKSKIQSGLLKIKIHNIPLSVAIGYDVCQNKDYSLEDLMKNAEDLMYKNKVSEGKKIRNNSIKTIYNTFIKNHEDEKKRILTVVDIALKIGQAMKMRKDDLKELELATLYHDIGKITIPEYILNKLDKLSKEERLLMEKHTENGYFILRAADQYSNLSSYALTHHEFWDGSGYPHGLKGDEIPLFSRIISVADSFEAMVKGRTYKEAISKGEAIQELKNNSGSQFDPNIVKIFVEEVYNKDTTDIQ